MSQLAEYPIELSGPPAPKFEPEEIITNAPTRSARLKWVVVVNDSVPVGHMANAVACIAASTGSAVAGLVAGGGPDAAGYPHPGLPWAGCTVLAASAQVVAETRFRAAATAGVLVVDMPASAQTHRVYDDYLSELAVTAPKDLNPCAISIVGPRNRVDKIIKRLALL